MKKKITLISFFESPNALDLFLLSLPKRSVLRVFSNGCAHKLVMYHQNKLTTVRTIQE